MQRKRGLRDRLVSLLELPGDVMLNVARIVMVGDMELVVENHRGVTEYTPERVALRVPEGIMAIDGHELRIGAISPDQVIILGKISGLRYSGPDGGAS